MAVAVDKRGLKRICMNCGTRFYDLAKRPIVCPSCSTEFVGDVKVKAKRGRAVVAEASPVTENKAANAPGEEEEEAVPNRQVVSLDEAAALEEGDDEDEDDIALGDDDDDMEEIDEDDEDLDEDLDIKTEKE